MKSTDPEQVKIDVIAYLEKTYKKKFGMEKIEWVCNEGNGCPDGHIVRCFLVEAPDLRFRVDIVYDRLNKKEIDIQRDEYLSSLIDYQADIELRNILEPEFKSYLTDVTVLANPITQIPKYNPLHIEYKQILHDYPNSIHIDITLYLLENDSTKKKEYLELSKEIIRYFYSLPIKELSLNIFFFNEKKYKSMTKEEIKIFFRQFDGVAFKDGDNCEKEWDMLFKKSEFPTVNSIPENLETQMDVYNLKK